MLTTEKASQTMYGVEPYRETPGEEYMGAPMRKHFTKLLNAWKHELMTGADRADQEEQEGEELALEMRNRDRERKLVKEIDKTLQKIQDEEYGWCESCGIEIGLRRLEARPTAGLCPNCEEITQKKEKTVGKG